MKTLRPIKVWFKNGKVDKYKKITLKQTNRIVVVVENLRPKNSNKEKHVKKIKK